MISGRFKAPKCTCAGRNSKGNIVRGIEVPLADLDFKKWSRYSIYERENTLFSIRYSNYIRFYKNQNEHLYAPAVRGYTEGIQSCPCKPGRINRLLTTTHNLYSKLCVVVTCGEIYTDSENYVRNDNIIAIFAIYLQKLKK